MTCKNCNSNFKGNFCSNCGQNHNIKRIDYKYLLSELSIFLLQLERGLFFTIKELFTRPGHCIREYLEGKRQNYYKPLSYLFVTAALYVLLMYLLGRNTFIGDLVAGFLSGVKQSKSTSDIEALDWISNNQTYVILLTIPLFSLSSFLVFIKYKYNYFEHLVLNLFVTGQQMIIYLVFSFIIYQENLLMIIPIVSGIVFNIWSYIQFFDNRKYFMNTLLTLFVYLIYSIQVIAVIGTITTIY